MALILPRFENIFNNSKEDSLFPQSPEDKQVLKSSGIRDIPDDDDDTINALIDNKINTAEFISTETSFTTKTQFTFTPTSINNQVLRVTASCDLKLTSGGAVTGRITGDFGTIEIGTDTDTTYTNYSINIMLDATNFIPKAAYIVNFQKSDNTSSDTAMKNCKLEIFYLDNTTKTEEASTITFA